MGANHDTINISGCEQKWNTIYINDMDANQARQYYFLC